MIGCGRSDLSPICRLESLEGGGEEVAVFDHEVTPLALYEIANDLVHILPQDFTIREDVIDRLSDAAQAVGPLLVLKCEIADLCSRSGIATL